MNQEDNYQPLLPQWNGQLSPGRSHLSGTMSGGTMLPPLNEDIDALNLRHLLSVARRRIFLLTGVSIAVACGVLMKVLTQTPIYEGNFRILVEPIKGQEKFEQINQTLAKATGKSGANLDYSTQIEVLWSQPVLNPIATQIKQKYPRFEQKQFQGSLTIQRLKDTKILDIRYQNSDPRKLSLF